MNEPLTLAWAGVAGVLLGGMFFGGLWWTVRKGVVSSRPALLFVASFVLRTSLALAGFYLVGREAWQLLACCLLGFVVARIIVTWFTRSPTERPDIETAEVRHAP